MAADVESMVLIVDMNGLHPRNVDFRVPKLFLETIQNRYPERISLILVVNAPWFASQLVHFLFYFCAMFFVVLSFALSYGRFFRFVWATVRRFFGPDLLQKVGHALVISLMLSSVSYQCE